MTRIPLDLPTDAASDAATRINLTGPVDALTADVEEGLRLLLIAGSNAGLCLAHVAYWAAEASAGRPEDVYRRVGELLPAGTSRWAWHGWGVRLLHAGVLDAAWGRLAIVLAPWAVATADLELFGGAHVWQLPDGHELERAALAALGYRMAA